MEIRQTHEQEQQPREFKKYCPFRGERSRCSSFCALWFQGVCSFLVIASYFAAVYPRPDAGEGEAA